MLVLPLRSRLPLKRRPEQGTVRRPLAQHPSGAHQSFRAGAFESGRHSKSHGRSSPSSFLLAPRLHLVIFIPITTYWAHSAFITVPTAARAAHARGCPSRGARLRVRTRAGRMCPPSGAHRNIYSFYHQHPSAPFAFVTTIHTHTHTYTRNIQIIQHPDNRY